MSDPSVQQVRPAEVPNFDRVRLAGWAVNAVAGRYCVAWRGAEEVVLVWQDGEWKQVAARGGRVTQNAKVKTQKVG